RHGARRQHRELATGTGAGPPAAMALRRRPHPGRARGRRDVDPRLKDLAAIAPASDAVILNINYPLGIAAYHILRQIAEVVDDLQGTYVPVRRRPSTATSATC